jgi:hypothetical protein
MQKSYSINGIIEEKEKEKQMFEERERQMKAEFEEKTRKMEEENRRLQHLLAEGHFSVPRPSPPSLPPLPFFYCY